MDADAIAATQPMRLRQALLIYVVLFAVTLVVGVLAISAPWFPGLLYFVCYFGAGIYLNRTVLRRIVEWHPIYNTIDNVANGKLAMFLFWPISYAVLFLKLGINRVL